jgi:ferredoxin
MIDYSDISEKRAAEIRAQMLEKPVRKIKVPKVLAVIDQSGCTGCEACIQFCPVDCIEIVPGPKFPDMEKVVEVDIDRCIGCKACAKYCPWDTIYMVPAAEAYQKGNDWTLRSVIDPANPEHQIWPRPEVPTAE